MSQWAHEVAYKEYNNLTSIVRNKSMHGREQRIEKLPHWSKATQQRISVSSSDPLQFTLVGVGMQFSVVTMHMRVRVWIPSPHDALQAPYSVKFPNTASAEEDKEG